MRQLSMQRVGDCDHSGAFLAAATSANTVTYRINALGQRVQKIGAGTFAQPTTLPFAVTLSNPPTQAQLQALNAQVTAFYANTRFIYDEQGRLLGENEHRASGAKFRRRLTLRSKVKRSGRSQYAKDGKLIQEIVWFDDLPVAVLKPKGASIAHPTSGTGNVATNNQDANNTGSNGNTAPPAIPTSKVNVEVFYIHPDHLGTPRVITASTALAATTGTGITSPQTINKAVWRWDSDPFGSNATANSAPNENPNTLSQVVGTATLPYLFGFDLAFPGQKRDRETGKHYNYFRDYDPAVGRYFESDPIGLKGGLSTFGYVGQKSPQFRDTFGLNSDPPPIDFSDNPDKKSGSACPDKGALCAFLRKYDFDVCAAWYGSFAARQNGTWNDPVLRPLENYLYSACYGASGIAVVGHQAVKIITWPLGFSSPPSFCALEAGLAGNWAGTRSRYDWRKFCGDECKTN